MAGGKRARIITFTILFAFGLLTVASSSDLNARFATIELVTPADELRYGNDVELRCVTDGFDVPYYISWQYLDPNDEYAFWKDMGCEGDTCVFVLDRNNADFYYRVLIYY